MEPPVRRPRSRAFDIVRELGLTLPRAKETQYYRSPAFEVDGGVFVVQPTHSSAEPDSICVAIELQRRKQLIAENPRVFYLKPHYEPYSVVLVRLNQLDREASRELLRSAYEAVVSHGVKMGSRVPRRPGSLSSKKKIRRRSA